MDYLDPEKKRKHRQRIAVGYMLLGLVIGAITLIVLLAGYGYGIDSKTGEFVQNGIMFVDTRHESTDVSLNGERYGQTDLRLVLREGDYSLVASRDGYRDWKRDVSIQGGSLRKLTYGLIIPETLQTESQFTLEELPTKAIQSIDKDRVFAWDSALDNTLLAVDITQDPATVQRISLEPLLTTIDNATEEPLKISDMTFVDFDSSDERVLTEVEIGGKMYSWLIDTGSIEESINITNTLPSAFQNDDVEVSMIDRNPSRYYVFDKTAGELYESELRGNSLSLVSLPDIDNKVLDFTGFGADWSLFVSESDGDEGLVDVYFRDNEDTVLVKQMKTSDEYFLSLSNNSGKPFIGISATSENAAFVYVDPIDYLRRNTGSSIPAPATILGVQDLLGITMSNDASVVMAFNESRVATYDFFSEDTHYTELDHTLSAKEQLKWIDGQHYSYVVDGTVWMIDYDGSNQQQLTSASATGIFYSDDSEGYFSFTSNDSQEEGANPQSFVFTSLLTEEDR